MWSIIDFGLRDFLRLDGKPLMFETYEQAEEWLLHRGEEYGWTNKGVRFFGWDDTEHSMHTDQKRADPRP